VVDAARIAASRLPRLLGLNSGGAYEFYPAHLVALHPAGQVARGHRLDFGRDRGEPP
jgi:hypothetical protein